MFSEEPRDAKGEEGEIQDAWIVLVQRWRLLVGGSLTAGLVALGLAFVIPKTYTARTSFLPPHQQQGGSAAAAISSLGALANLAGGGGLRTPADQYVSLLQSVNVQESLIDRFELLKVYDVDYRMEAREELGERVRISLSKRDGIIAIEVDDRLPQRAADLANAYVEELRRITSTLAVTEAQQRRSFFGHQLTQARDRLTAAQLALQATGISTSALRAEPKAVAENYAKLKAEVTAAEVRLQSIRGSLTENAPEVVQQLAGLGVLRSQLAKAEQSGIGTGEPDYVGKYREFKYQEALFELHARQYELARVDEAREGGLVQVIDVAQPPERKSKPRRARLAIVTTLVVAALLAMVIVGHHRFYATPTGRRLWRALQAR